MEALLSKYGIVHKVARKMWRLSIEHTGLPNVVICSHAKHGKEKVSIVRARRDKSRSLRELQNLRGKDEIVS
ncbi:hypothetical protein CR513_53305, partial [Mucuna pruriens]